MADLQTDAAGDSSAPQQDAPSGAQEDQVIEQPSEEKEPPFHEHPRWKERTEEIQSLREELKQLKEQGQQPKEDLTSSQFSPEMRKIISTIKSETKAEFLKEIEEARKKQAEINEQQEEEVKSYIKSIEKQVGGKETFESSFKPFYADLVSKAQAMTGDKNTHVDVDFAISEWKKTQSGDPKIKVATKSRTGKSPDEFKIRPGDNLDSIADRFLEEKGLD